MQRLNPETTTCVLSVNTMPKSQKHIYTFAALIGLSTIKHNLFTISTSQISWNEITSKNSLQVQFWQIDTSRHFTYTRLNWSSLLSDSSHGRSADQHRLCFHISEKSCGQIDLTASVRAFFPREIFVVTQEKRAVSYLSVSPQIRVIDSQMKREYGKMLNDADLSANRICHMYVPSHSFALYPPGNFSRLYLFVEDTNLLYAVKNLKSIETTIKAEIFRVYNWLIANKLSLNITNLTQFVIFSGAPRARVDGAP